MEVRIEKLLNEENPKTCLISQEIFNKLELSTEELYKIHLGQKVRNCHIKPDKDKLGKICLSNIIFDRLSATKDITLNIWRKDKDIYLGPVVGVFVNTYLLGRIKSKIIPFNVLQHLKASLKEKCLCYYFSIDDIDWETKKIRGITLNPVTNEREVHWFPMPNIIYDRGVFFEPEQKPTVKQIRRKFRRNPNMKFINAINTLGKWEVCNQLYKYPEIREYIPETIVYTDIDDVLNMLKKHKYIFVKSFYGTQGREVMSIEDIGESYKMNFYEDGVKEIITTDTKEVETVINKFVEDKAFIVQQGLRVLKYEGHNADLYILLDKNENGEWQAMYNQSTIAKGKLSITNPDAGGDYTIYEEIYPKLKSEFCKGKIPNGKEVDEITIKIAKYIEKEFGSFGEMGMDMAIDIYGKVWIIEANSRPDKDLCFGNLDIKGRPWLKLQLETYSNKTFKNETDYLEEVLPQALAIFKYSKYLMK